MKTDDTESLGDRAWSKLAAKEIDREGYSIIEKLTKRCERYEKALREIAKGPDYPSQCGECFDNAAMDLMDIAKQALEGG